MDCPTSGKMILHRPMKTTMDNSKMKIYLQPFDVLSILPEPKVTGFEIWMIRDSGWELSMVLRTTTTLEQKIPTRTKDPCNSLW